MVRHADPHIPEHGEAMIPVFWNLPVRLAIYPPKHLEPFRAGHLSPSDGHPEVGFRQLVIQLATGQNVDYRVGLSLLFKNEATRVYSRLFNVLALPFI